MNNNVSRSAAPKQAVVPASLYNSDVKYSYLKDYTDTMGSNLSKLLSIVSDFEREEHLKYKLA